MIDGPTTNDLQMNAPWVIDSIKRSATRVRGYENGHYPANYSNNSQNTNSEVTSLLLAAVTKFNNHMDNGIKAETKFVIKEYDDFRNKMTIVEKDFGG